MSTTSKKKCQTKWSILTDKEMNEYDTGYITCKTCHSHVRPRTVHTLDGDYFCIYCNNYINISHFCINCKLEHYYD